MVVEGINSVPDSHPQIYPYGVRAEAGVMDRCVPFYFNRTDTLPLRSRIPDAIRVTRKPCGTTARVCGRSFPYR